MRDLDDVPIWIPKGSLPRIRDEAEGAEQSPHLVTTMVSDTEGHDKRILSSMRARFERLVGPSVVGLRVHGEKWRRPNNTSGHSHCGRLT